MESRQMETSVTPLAGNNDTNASAKKMNKETKIILAVAISVAVLIMGLVIGNIVIKINSNGSGDNTISEEEEEEEEVEEEEEYDDIATAPINKTTYADKLEYERSLMDDPDNLGELIKLYQKYIDIFQNEIKDDDIALSLYDERIDLIRELDDAEDYKYGDQIVADLISIDNILQTGNSALDVYNSANSFGKTDIAEQYYQILQERVNNNSGDWEDDEEDEEPEEDTEADDADNDTIMQYDQITTATGE